MRPSATTARPADDRSMTFTVLAWCALARRDDQRAAPLRWPCGKRPGRHARRPLRLKFPVAGRPAKADEQVRPGKRGKPVRLVRRGLGRVGVPADRKRKGRTLLVARHRILRRRDDQVEQPAVGSGIAETNDLRPAATLLLDPSRDGDASAADADHQVGPGWAETCAWLYRSGERAASGTSSA